MAEAQMSENVGKNRQKLSAKREKAANQVSEDFLPDEKIAAEVGISARTLDRWKNDRAFIARVDQISDAFAERALKHGLARRAKRLALLNEHHDNLLQVIDERKTDPELANVPGGKTGLVTKTVKGIGKGDDYRVVDVFEVDIATIREMRQIYEQVAEETGQKTNKLDVTQHTAPFDPVAASDEELLRHMLSTDYKLGGGLSAALHDCMHQYIEEKKQRLAAGLMEENTSAAPDLMQIDPKILAMIQSGTQPDAEENTEAEESVQ